MKRLFCAFFVLLVIFNSVEYYGLIFLAQTQMTEQVLHKIEANSSELGGNLILAIPIELPYSSDSEGYTTIEGQFVYNGEVYRMVKQKFYHSMLYVVCIKDDQSTKLNSAIADYSKLFSGKRAGSANSSFKMINSLSKDYVSKVAWPKPAYKPLTKVLYSGFSNLYRFDFISSIFRPPQYC